jgi:prepilin-type processing-associated H-X9-DG protein
LGARERIVHPSFANCPPESNHYRAGRAGDQCHALHFWSLHAGGAHFLFADGSTRFLSYDAAPLVPALMTRNGRETVTLPD